MLDAQTAGDPVQEGARWTSLRRPQSAARLEEAGFAVSLSVVDRLLEQAHLGYRRPQKIKTMPQRPDRHAQLEHLAELRRIYEESGEPILSLDTKRRETLGEYVRPGQVLAAARPPAWDHDFPTRSLGVVRSARDFRPGAERRIDPLGPQPRHQPVRRRRPLGWVENVRPKALSPGGRPAGAMRLRREPSLPPLGVRRGLAGVADASGPRIRIAHYPSGCSQHNPLEHRLLPDLTRECQGMFLTRVEQVRELMRQAATGSGLRTFARILRGAYETGKKALIKAADDLCIALDDVLPAWNYVVFPKVDWEVI